MKKIAFIIALAMFLSSCTVQEKMSPWIFIERVNKNDNNIIFDVNDSFYSNESFVCYASYNGKKGFCVEIPVDENGNSEKISLACADSDKTDEFVLFSKCIINTYSPDDSVDDVLNHLFENIEINNEFIHYETQWYDYSATFSEHGLYFSVESRKISPRSEVEFSLKPNDIVEY